MTMPFSPCSSDGTSECQDVSVDTLKQIFGPVIDNLVIGGDPNSVSASSNIIASMFSTFNSSALILICIIITGSLFVGVANTANDGEAMGKNWSSVWTSTRIVTFGGLMIPTASGYCFLQLLVMMIVLWGIGAANGVYKVGVAVGIVSPNAIVGGINKTGAYYGLRDLANNYLAVSYCAKVSNSIYSNDDSKPNVQLKSINSNSGDVSYIMADTNSSTNLAGGLGFCGGVSLSDYVAKTSDDQSELLLEKLHQNLQQVKQRAANQMLRDIDSWVQTWPVSLNSQDWANVDSAKLNTIISTAESSVVDASLSQGSQSGSSLNNIMKQYVETITDKGWADAAGWFQRVGAIRSALSNVTSLPAGKVTQPSYVLLPSDSRTSELVSTVNTVTDTIIKKADEKDANKDRAVSPMDVANTIPKNADSIDISSLQNDINGKLNNMSGAAMSAIVDTLTDASGNSTTLACGTAGQIGGSLNRMKCVGDYLAVLNASTNASIVLIKTGVSALRITSGAASSVKVFGVGVDADKVTTPLWDWVLSVVVDNLATFQSALSWMALYFSVLLPSLPYGIYMIVVAGYFVAVFQSAVAIMLWGMMHMTPERSFIGSQTQGYLLLVGLFMRPSLSVLGLFAAILLSDPIINFISTSFFAMHGAITTSTGVIGSIAQWVTFQWWMAAYAFIMLSVLYMVFALPQILPDHVLKWINVGISDLGETSASSNMRGRLEQMNLMNGGGGGGAPLQIGSNRGLEYASNHDTGGTGNERASKGEQMIDMSPGIAGSSSTNKDRDY